MVSQFCEYTKNAWIIHFIWVNYMMCELYLNKAEISEDIIFAWTSKSEGSLRLSFFATEFFKLLMKYCWFWSNSQWCAFASVF